MAGRVGGEDDPEEGDSVVLGVGAMIAGGVPQWKRDLLRRRRQAANTSHSSARPAPVDMLLRDDANDTNHLETTPDEELTYGPGIVKKLKSRYLSLTLREATIKSRPSINGLRRAASLEHGLDEEPSPPTRKFQPKNDVITTGRPTRYRQVGRNLEAAKRARSVDALVRCDSRSENEELLPISPIELEPPIDKTNRPKRPPPLLKETERPPPDLVKTTLKIFECRNGKKTKNVNSHTGQVADKVKSFTDQVKAKRAGPRPAIPPRGPGLLLSPDPKGNTCATQTTPSLMTRPPPSPKKSVGEMINNRDRSLSPVYGNKHPVILTQLESPKSDYPSVRGVSPLVLEDNSPQLSPGFSPDRLSANGDNKRHESDSNLYIRTSTPDPDISIRPAATEISLISPTPMKNIRIESTRKISDASSSSDISDENVFEVNGDQDDVPSTKQVTKSVIENISKASTTTHFSFNGSMSNGQSNKSHLPSVNVVPLVCKVKPKTIEDEIKIPIKTPSLTPTYPIAAVNPKILLPLSPLIIPKSFPGANAEESVLITTPKRDIVIPALKTPISPPKIKDVVHAQSIDSSPALVHYNSPSPTALTSREIEKNLINTSKSLEQPLKKVVVTMVDSHAIQKDPIVVKEDVKKNIKEDPKKKEESAKKIVKDEPKRVIVKENVVIVKTKESSIGGSVNSVLVSDVKNVSSPSAVNGFSRLSGKRPDRQQSQNSTVYDFSKRKEVPDYVENDGVILRTSMREKPRPQVECRVSLRGDVSGGESCTDGFDDSSFEDGDFDYAGDEWTAGPPSPCDVDFENANVLINGRSNMSVGAKSRAKQLKIQFDDSLTQTFEYPSEASLGEDLSNITASPVANPSPLATGGSLSTYTPSKVQLQVDSYQLGVTKSSTGTQPSTNGQKVSDSDAANVNGDVVDNVDISSLELGNSGVTKSLNSGEEEDYLKPCQEAESHNWSHETHLGAGDLLF